MSGPNDLHEAQSKTRVLGIIASAYRFYDDCGESLFAGQWREDFENVTGNLASLTALWHFLSEPLRAKVREKIENPAMEVISADGSSWQGYERDLVLRLDNGEYVDF